MRTRLRGPGGASTIKLADDATIGDLIAQVIEKTSITKFDLSYGYPPKPLLLEQYENSRPLKDLGVKLDGEQLIINRNEGPVVPKEPTPKNHQIHQNDSVAKDMHRVPPTTGSFSFADTANLPTADAKGKESGPIAFQKKTMAGDVPELPMPERGSTLVLRVMPDDNSCLFRAFATAFIRTGDDMSMPELRSIVAGAIQQDSEKYTTVVLEKKPDDYCRWIQTPDAWGGDIEMGILAKHFEVEICSIDVQSLGVVRYNEGQEKRIILVYSGIHYDTIVQAPSDPPHTKANFPPELDVRVWDADDGEILAKALQLCKKLQELHYFTDTGGMAIKCQICSTIVYGEVQASMHAQESGHYDMAEI